MKLSDLGQVPMLGSRTPVATSVPTADSRSVTGQTAYTDTRVPLFIQRSASPAEEARMAEQRRLDERDRLSAEREALEARQRAAADAEARQRASVEEQRRRAAAEEAAARRMFEEQAQAQAEREAYARAQQDREREARARAMAAREREEAAQRNEDALRRRQQEEAEQRAMARRDLERREAEQQEVERQRALELQRQREKQAQEELARKMSEAEARKTVAVAQQPVERTAEAPKATTVPGKEGAFVVPGTVPTPTQPAQQDPFTPGANPMNPQFYGKNTGTGSSASTGSGTPAVMRVEEKGQPFQVDPNGGQTLATAADTQKKDSGMSGGTMLLIVGGLAVLGLAMARNKQ